jgi:phage N-6-adenine-methyltransferase
MNNTNTEYEFHPLANLFPLLESEKLEPLAEDIKQKGLQNNIILFEGKILDGRNRYTACELVGVEPRFSEYSGDDPLSYVVSLNLHRRHLTESQRAMVAARVEKLKHGGNRQDANLHVGRAEAAEKLNVSTRSVASAKKVQTKGIEELVNAVDQGQVAVSKAVEIADLPKEDQKKTVAQLIISSESNEWYTPAKYIDSARKVMGGIDLDPASCIKGNEGVKAAQFFTKEDDGLSKDWCGRVWMNPPYGGLTAKFVTKLVEEFDKGTVTEAVLLINANGTDTKWFQHLWDHLVVFTHHRIDFIKGDGGEKTGSTHGSAFVYMGPNTEAFNQEFSQYGAVVKRLPEITQSNPEPLPVASLSSHREIARMINNLSPDDHEFIPGLDAIQEAIDFARVKNN